MAERTGMKVSELGPLWLRERAVTLRHGANDLDRAYSPGGPMRKMCARVAAAYRKAAAMLDDEATKMDDEADHG